LPHFVTGIEIRQAWRWLKGRWFVTKEGFENVTTEKLFQKIACEKFHDAAISRPLLAGQSN
jgi:hypothetical protein